MEKKTSRPASDMCPLCKRPIAAEQRPSVKFNSGQQVHPECYAEFVEEEADRQKLG
jgi:hypothetical protein